MADAMLRASMSRTAASTASVSRSKASQDSMKSEADEMLRQSLSKSPGASAAALSSSPAAIPPSASASRSKTSQDTMKAAADEMLRQSLSRSQEGSATAVSSSATAIPPSASASRSKSSPDTLKSAADEMLRQSLSTSRRTATTALSSSSTAVPSSASRARSSEYDMKKLADDMIRQSVSKSSVPSFNSIAPPRPQPSMNAQRSPRDSKRGTFTTTTSTKTTMPPPYEASATSSPPASRRADAEKLKLKLQLEESKANAVAPPRKTDGLFRKACSTDLLFLIDATNSMELYIESVKTQVKSIVSDIKAAFLGQAQVRIAVVSYKDHLCTPNVEFQDFTSSTEDIHQFLDALQTDWGRDYPEDVLGGIQQATNASWQFPNRCIVHIGDAPPHGRTLHDLSESSDHYYKTGSEPHGLTFEPLIRRLVQFNVNYAFLRITGYTDRMAMAFSKLYGPSNAKLHTSNRYHDEDRRHTGSMNVKPSLATGPQFEELPLGTTYNALQSMVVRSVTSSFSRTAGRVSKAWSQGNGAPNQMLGQKHLTAICEDEDSDDFDSSRKSQIASGFAFGGGVKGGAANPKASNGTTTGAANVVLEKVNPQFDTPGWLDVSMDTEGFCPAAVLHNSSTLNEMMAADENIKLSVTELTIRFRSKPFAKGSIRKASYARTSASQDRFVVKSFIKHGHGSPEVAEDMRIQALCKAFALEFNSLLNIEPPLDFVVSCCLESKSKHTLGSENGCLSLEPYINGTYIKYNSNWGFAETDDSEFNQAAQAFSHFTFERSWGHLLVNDLQGVGRLLTDPAIQTKDKSRFKLNDANLGEESMKCFFASHECNPFCLKLGLKTSKDMWITGKFEFRDRWPAMDPTTCCSNKLCRSIVRVADAHKSSRFPDYHWCKTCWPQLELSTARWICLQPGPSHDFEISKFFFESQGQLAPRKCPAHREKDASKSSAAAVGGSLWSKLKSTDPEAKVTISGKVW